MWSQQRIPRVETDAQHELRRLSLQKQAAGTRAEIRYDLDTIMTNKGLRGKSTRVGAQDIRPSLGLWGGTTETP